MTPLTWALAVIACGVGALARWGLGRLQAPDSWPWAMVAANALGCLGLGVVAGAVGDGASETWLLVLGGGLAGGLTTFSTLAVDAVALLRAQRRRASAAYLGATFAIGLAAVAAGWLLWQVITIR